MTEDQKRSARLSITQRVSHAIRKAGLWQSPVSGITIRSPRFEEVVIVRYNGSGANLRNEPREEAVASAMNDIRTALSAAGFGLPIKQRDDRTLEIPLV